MRKETEQPTSGRTYTPNSRTFLTDTEYNHNKYAKIGKQINLSFNYKFHCCEPEDKCRLYADHFSNFGPFCKHCLSLKYSRQVVLMI